MSESQQPLPYAELMPDIYRFAFLMTGSVEVSAAVLRIGVERAARTLRQIRDASKARRWLFSQARVDCAAATGQASTPAATAGEAAVLPPEVPVPDVSHDQPRQLALVFALLPEPERCAAALFYLYLLTPVELSEIMELKPHELGSLLSRGRALLQRNRLLTSELLANSSALPV